VPHEQRGVPTAAPVAAMTPARRWRSKKAEIFSVSVDHETGLNAKALAMKDNPK